ncbi:MAG TPA: 4-hydroxybenzoate octaprenyltransferase [Gammaproteobacteria bacterium]|nr:4-hydroxybenzoate octaprenyltransferase [Gammaproteobacteria bacterium]
MFEKIKQFIYLTRLNKPIGIFLLLWPALWALWLASTGRPDANIVFIFIAGVIVMRAAGCVVNDIADRNFDGEVERTRKRPLVTQKITLKEAWIVFLILISCAFTLVLFLNSYSIFLAFIGAFLAILYPFMKRFTHLPQLGLGLAFAWSIPMAFAAETNSISFEAWILFLAAAIWPVIYDTMYAMVDEIDDIKIGVKSTAILFGKWDKIIVGLLQIIFLLLFVWIGFLFKLRLIYFLSVLLAGLLFIYQQVLIKSRDRENCFKAFLNNHWVGLIVFLGIFMSYSL